jgi:hypothetical protein
MGRLRRAAEILTDPSAKESPMVVPIILVAIVAVLVLHGFLLRKRRSVYHHGVYFDVGASHTLTMVESMQDFAPSPRRRGFDTQHWNSIYWG